MKCNILLDLLLKEMPMCSPLHGPCKKRSRTGFAPPLLQSWQWHWMLHDAWSLRHQRQCQGMGAHFIQLQVAVRNGKSSWNSWLIAGFSKHGTWLKAAACRHTLYWSTAAWPLERKPVCLEGFMQGGGWGRHRVWNCRLTQINSVCCFRYDVAEDCFFFLTSLC